MYGCGILICLSSGLHRVVILSNSIKVYFRSGILINWCLQEFMFRLVLVIRSNSILDVE